MIEGGAPQWVVGGVKFCSQGFSQALVGTARVTQVASNVAGLSECCCASSGQSWILPSGILAPVRFASVRFAPWLDAWYRSAKDRSAPVRSAMRRSAPIK